MIVFKDIDEASAKPDRPVKTIASDSKTNVELAPKVTPENKIEAEPEPAPKARPPLGRSKGKAVKK